MRSLEVSLPMRQVIKVERVRMVVAAKGEAYVDSFERVLSIGETKREEDEGCIVTVRSMGIDGLTGYPIGTGLAERVFSSARKNSTEIHIWEETGESIARHVWYA